MNVLTRYRELEINGRSHVACCMCDVRTLVSRSPLWTDHDKTANATTQVDRLYPTVAEERLYRELKEKYGL